MLAPENTLAGLRTAAARGYRGVEFDVMLSAESTPYLIHDETLERTTDGAGAVAHTPDAVLDALDAGRWRGPAFAGEPLPRFEAAARLCRELDLWPNVEIKPAPGHEEETGRRVALDAARLWAGAAFAPLLSSFSEVALAAAREAAPALPRGLLVAAVPADWRERARRLGCAALHFDARGVEPAALQSLHGAGCWLVAYTVNDPSRAAALLAQGLDALITDRLDLIPPG